MWHTKLMIQLVYHILTYDTMGMPHFDLWYNWYATFWLIIQLAYQLHYKSKCGIPIVCIISENVTYQLYHKSKCGIPICIISQNVHILTYDTIRMPHFDLWYNWYTTFWLMIQWVCHILTYDTIGMPHFVVYPFVS
jgi:hypothetical protein